MFIGGLFSTACNYYSHCLTSSKAQRACSGHALDNSRNPCNQGSKASSRGQPAPHLFNPKCIDRIYGRNFQFSFGSGSLPANSGKLGTRRFLFKKAEPAGDPLQNLWTTALSDSRCHPTLQTFFGRLRAPYFNRP